MAPGFLLQPSVMTDKKRYPNFPLIVGPIVPVVMVPDQAEGSAGLENSSKLLQGLGSSEPVECLRSARSTA